MRWVLALAASLAACKRQQGYGREGEKEECNEDGGEGWLHTVPGLRRMLRAGDEEE